MCKFNTKITIVQLLRLTIVSAKSKIHSPRRGSLSLGNSVVLEIAAALLFISTTNSCQFWDSFVETQAHFQQTVYFRELCTRCGPMGTTEPSCNLKIESCKKFPKCFSWIVTFYIRGTKFMLFSCRKLCC